MSDNVEHPSHYNAGGVETIEGIRAALGDGFSDYCLGNVLKYVWRCKHKGKLLEDLRKASKYLEWAIEAAESNCLEMPDSSSGKAIPIPSGWRELEPDEIPLATDMHEWMGGWFYRNTDATHEYQWHSSRHIRKIETGEPNPLAIPEGWRELNQGELLSMHYLYELNGEWTACKHDPLGDRYSSRIHRRHIRKIETANASEVPNSSIPDPGPGYRLLSKDPPERLLDTDEGFFANGRDGGQWLSVNYSGGDQLPLVCYRRKIEPAQWVPKVGDKVRLRVPVLYPTRDSCNYEGRITEISQSGRFTIFFASEDQRIRGWVKPKDLYLIEAAS